MVDFVLDYARPQSLKHILPFMPEMVVAGHFDLVVSFNVYVDIRQTQAAFDHLSTARAHANQGINQEKDPALYFGHEKPLGDTRLWSGKSNPFVLSHEAKHLIEHIRKPPIEPFHWLA